MQRLPSDMVLLVWMTLPRLDLIARNHNNCSRDLHRALLRDCAVPKHVWVTCPVSMPKTDDITYVHHIVTMPFEIVMCPLEDSDGDTARDHQLVTENACETQQQVGIDISDTSPPSRQ